MVIQPPRLVQFWALVGLGLLVRAFAAGLLPTAGEVAVVPLCMDINAASVSQLALLPGLGRFRAEAIVLFRVRHGPFASLAELEQVDGIGPELVAGLAACCEVLPAELRRASAVRAVER